LFLKYSIIFKKGQEMKAIISQSDMQGGTLWECEALSFTWDSNKGEFVFRGDRNNRDLSGVIVSMMHKHRLTNEVEDDGPGELVWRGYLGSARFETDESGSVDCYLSMALEDWFGISTAIKVSTAS
jgi:hypothetical protein